MKNTIIILVSFIMVGLGVSAAHAHDVISIGIHMGVPYYAEPAPYYVEAEETQWWNTPVEIVYIEGVPHRMHMWHGHWYDESWSHRHVRRMDDHHDGRDYREDRDDRHHGGGWRW